MDRHEKRDMVAFMVSNGYSKKRIMEEIDRCIVLCANHHRQLHFMEKQDGGEHPFSPNRSPAYQQSASKRGAKRNKQFWSRRRKRIREDLDEDED